MKLSFTTVLVVVIVAAVGYLAFDPDAARDLSNWVRRQAGGAPSTKGLSSPNYTPVIPGK